MRALQSADVILFDDLVSRDVLDFARREAQKDAGRQDRPWPLLQAGRHQRADGDLAKQGKRVVRLKGGDPLIFGRAGEEIAACRAANIAVESCPASPRRRARPPGSAFR